MTQVETPKPSAVRARTVHAAPAQTSGAGEAMTGAQALIRALEMAGATDIFGYPGGAILPAYDPLMDSPAPDGWAGTVCKGRARNAEGFGVSTCVMVSPEVER